MSLFHDEKVGREGLPGSPRRVLAVPLALVLLLSGGAAAQAGGLIITPTFDSSITGDVNAAAIEGTINSVIQTYENTFVNPANITIYFREINSGLGSSQSAIYNLGYQSFRTGLASNQAISGQSDQATALANLPTGASNPVTGTAALYLTNADIKALMPGSDLPGILAPDHNQYDGIVSLNTSATSPPGTLGSGTYSLASVTMHEINEVLGLRSALPPTGNPLQIPAAEDLYRYDANGNRSFTTDSNATSYFSLDGHTQLAQFNQSSGGDYGDWKTGATPQVQDAFATPGANPTLGAAELTALDAIGYDQVVVPEPATASLCGLGIALVIAARRKRRARAAIAA